MNEFESLLFYFFWMFLSCLLFYIYTYFHRKYKKGKTFCILAIGIMVFIMAFRANVGTDYKSYTNIFNYVRTHGWNFNEYPSYVNCEWGFLSLVKILTYSFSNQGIWGFLTIMFFVFTILGLKEYEDNKKFSMTLAYIYFLVFFYSYAFNGFRQMLAISIGIYAMKFLFEDSKKYFTYILLASLVHYSALVMLTYWLLWNHKEKKIISKRNQYKILTVLLVIVLFYRNCLNFVMKIPFLSFLQRYSYILATERGGNKTFVFFVIIAIVIAIISKHLNKIDSRNEFYSFLLYLNVIVGIAALSNKFIYRLCIYFQIGYITLIPYIPECFSRHNKTVAKIGVALVAIIYFFILLCNRGRRNLSISVCLASKIIMKL